MLRILVLSLYYWPDDTGIAVFARGRCEYLAAQGHEVTVCTGMPFYPQWRIADKYRGKFVAREEHDGVTILRSFLYVPRQASSVKRIAHEASFTLGALLRAFASRRPDIILVISPPLALGLVAIILSRKWRVPYVFHVADLQPDAALELGMLPNGPFMRTLYWLERSAYQNSAMVSTLTQGMRKRILEKGFSADKVILFPDWVDPSLYNIPLVSGGRRFRCTHGLEDEFLVLHAGNMGVKQGLEVVLGAADLSRNRSDVKYMLVGDGAARPLLKERARNLRLSNVTFLPLQNREIFNEMMAAADLALVTQLRSVTDIVFPSKVLTLLAAGRPVAASLGGGSEVARVLKDSAAGIQVPPEDPRALLNAIETLRDRPRQRARMGERGRAYARMHWDKDQILPELNARLQQIAARNPV